MNSLIANAVTCTLIGLSIATMAQNPGRKSAASSSKAMLAGKRWIGIRSILTCLRFRIWRFFTS
ncbi:MAG: hypothetical protein WA830_26235 [Candidatus Sulfotelmatobacter sp.]